MLTILSNFNHAGHVKRRWGEITGIIVTVTTLKWSDIFTKVTKCIIVLKIIYDIRQTVWPHAMRV